MGVHDGHRKRLRKRLAENGYESLAPHEALELLLSYSIPRKDTNGLAHELIKRFGSLSGVLGADINELIDTEGVGENTAALINLAANIRKYDAVGKRVYLRTSDEIAEFAAPLFDGAVSESLWIICLNDSGMVKRTVKVLDGDFDAITFQMRKLTTVAIRTESKRIILVHNHPGRLSIPSVSDIDATKFIIDSLSTNDIELVEHVVLGIEGHTGILECIGMRP